MKALNACPACGSTKTRSYSLVSESERPGSIHFSQSHCNCCDVVFSNPVAEPEELAQFYQDEYYQNVETVFSATAPDLREKVLARAAEAEEGLRRMVLPYKAGGTFFEIGAGYGAVLEAAKRLGFEVAGVEPSQPAVDFAREELGLERVACSLFNGSDWPEAWVDVVYSHHTIEHVIDLPSFVDGIRRILKPGGIAVIGTENHRCSFWDSRRLYWKLKGSLMREFVTSHEHTYVFSRKSLRRAMERSGLRVFGIWVYTLPFAAKHGGGEFRSIFTKAFTFGLHGLDVALRRGGRIYIWCEKE